MQKIDVFNAFLKSVYRYPTKGVNTTDRLYDANEYRGALFKKIKLITAGLFFIYYRVYHNAVCGNSYSSLLCYLT